MKSKIFLTGAFMSALVLSAMTMAPDAYAIGLGVDTGAHVGIGGNNDASGGIMARNNANVGVNVDTYDRERARTYDESDARFHSGVSSTVNSDTSAGADENADLRAQMRDEDRARADVRANARADARENARIDANADVDADTHPGLLSRLGLSGNASARSNLRAGAYND